MNEYRKKRRYIKSNIRLELKNLSVNKFDVARKTISLASYCEVEFPDYPLTEAGDGKFYGPCPLHKEQHGQAFSLDARTGRWWCRGKCRISAGDITELEYRHRGGTRKEAVQRLLANARRYPAKAYLQSYKLRDGVLVKKKRYASIETPKWPWRKLLQPFPDEWISRLAKQRQLRERAVREATRRGLLWCFAVSTRSGLGDY